MMWIVVVGCISAACNWSANYHDATRSYLTAVECDAALIQIAKNWNPGMNGGWTFNCVRKYD